MTLPSVKRPFTDIESPTEPPTAPRPRLAMASSEPSTLAFAENKLDDATHKRLDDIVLKRSAEPSNQGLAIYLLLRILQNSEKTLDPQYLDLNTADTLLEQHEELLELLQAAWQKKSFRDIRNLEILRPPPPPRSTSPRLDSRFPEKAVLNAWNMPYIGDNHLHLLNNINRMWCGPQHTYSTTAAVVQSSGSGKSRLVHEQANLVFTLPFNLRREDLTNGNVAPLRARVALNLLEAALAHPPSDPDIREHLVGGEVSYDDSRVRCLQLFGNVFFVVSKVLDEWTGTEDEGRERLSKAARWRAYMEQGDNRKKLYADAVDLCECDQLREWRQKHPRPEHSSMHPDVYAAAEEAKARLRILLKQIDDHGAATGDPSTESVKLMLCFDDAHVLAAKAVYGAADLHMYNVLCACVYFLRPLPIFAIFLSTDSTVNQVGRKNFKFVAFFDSHEVQAPITQTPFDCSPDVEVAPGRLDLNTLSQVQFMARFGRPLWWTTVAGGGEAAKALIIDFARSKLIHHNDIRTARSSMSDGAATAVLDVLLSLDLDASGEKAEAVQAEMVASHMRTAFSASSDRPHIRSGYPSEPILAEAAARQMNELQSQDPHVNVMARLLLDQFKNDLIDGKARGELVWRQLAMEAYLRGVRTEQSTRRPEEGNTSEGYNFSEGCRLVTFIEELFSESYAKVISNSVSDSVAREPRFAEAFKDARVRFTHFGITDDDAGLTSPALLAAFVRGMAIICRSSHGRVDVAIPVLLRPDEPLAESSVTAVLVEVNLRRGAGWVGKDSIDQQDVGLFLGSEEVRRPYVALVAELGQPPKSVGGVRKGEVRGDVRGERRSPAMRSPAKSSKTMPSGLNACSSPTTARRTETKHPRYSVFAYGCSDAVYRVINGDEESRMLYRSMLAHKDVLDEHPRSDKASLEAVRRLKPFWSNGEASFHWIKSSLRDIKMDEDSDEVEDGKVTVGIPAVPQAEDE